MDDQWLLNESSNREIDSRYFALGKFKDSRLKLIIKMDGKVAADIFVVPLFQDEQNPCEKIHK